MNIIPLIILATVIARKQWSGKTTLLQYLIVYDVVTKQIVLQDIYKTLVW